MFWQQVRGNDADQRPALHLGGDVDPHCWDRDKEDHVKLVLIAAANPHGLPLLTPQLLAGGGAEITALPLVPVQFRQRAVWAVAEDDRNAAASLANGGGAQTEGGLAEDVLAASRLVKCATSVSALLIES